ncbi:MAG: HU family DNA-binding protein [Bacteriovoracaceae bacterium]|nr:HU family DNA-binding protein [Bacteriovoracaceae bacterium]
MNRKELLDEILQHKDLTDWSRKECDTFLLTMLDTIKKTVKKGDDVTLIGFGSFTKVRRKARMGVNPSTGEKIKIKAKNVVKFRPGKAFNEIL